MIGKYSSTSDTAIRRPLKGDMIKVAAIDMVNRHTILSTEFERSLIHFFRTRHLSFPNQEWAHTAPSNGPGADDDADNNVEYWLRQSGLGIPRALHQEMPRTTSLPSSRLLNLFGANASYGAFISA
jgi:hypothetical protein